MSNPRRQLAIRGIIFVVLVVLLFFFSRYIPRPFSAFAPPGEDFDDFEGIYSNSDKLSKFLQNLGPISDAGGTLRVRVRPASAATYANSATLASAELSTVTSNSTSTTTGSLTVARRRLPLGILSGNATTATYVITLQTQSPAAAATGITVRDDLAAGFSYAGTVSITGASATTSPAVGDASPTWTGLSIPGGSTATITFTGRSLTSARARTRTI